MSETRGWSSKAVVLGAAVVLGVAIIVMSVGGNVATAAKPQPPRFVDNGNGTITDRQTGLMWQKTDDAGGVTDKDIQRTWDLNAGDTSDSANGSSIFTWLDRLNGRLTNDPSVPGFAGHTDWRIPTVFELQTILLAPFPSCTVIPCIDPIFGPVAIGPVGSYYWSSSSHAGNPIDAWFVFFAEGFVSATSKSDNIYVRAVRGGS